MISIGRVRPFRWACLVLFLLSVAPSVHAVETEAWQPIALSHSGTLIAQDALPIVLAPAVDLRAVTAEDRQRDLDGLPPRFAMPNAVTLRPGNDGVWEQVGADTLVWRLRIGSPGAKSLNLGFGSYWMPEGGRLLIYSADGGKIVRPFTAEDNAAHGELWTPLIPADEIVLEVTLPKSMERALKLDLSQVNVGYRPIGDTAEPLSGSCNVDVICPQGVAWRDEIQASGMYSRSGVFTCSGSMLNNTAQDGTPYFLTANHCGVNSGNAASMVVYWNFETSTCGGTPNGNLNTFQTGAFFRASSSSSDFTLVEMDSAPLPQWDITFAGWDRSGASPGSAVAIHHPNLDEKRISFENDPVTVTSYLANSIPGNSTHIRVTDWDLGTTEGGSSGSPLFDPNHRVIGQLHGGYASCSSQTSDWYGRLSVSWTGGGSNSSRLSNWLDPGNTGATFVDTLAEDVPSLSSVAQVADDSQGNGDSVVDPGETIILEIDLANTGSLTATGVAGTLTSSTPGVTVVNGAGNWPNIADGQIRTSNAPHLTVLLDPAFNCGDSIDFHLDLVANESPGAWSTDFSVGTGTANISAIFADDMESGTNGWTSQTLSGTANNWTQVTSNSNSPTHSWFVSDIASVSDSVLVSPTLTNLPANATLRFQDFLNSESTYDGGVLEFSTNGTSWGDLQIAITEGIYNSLISSDYSSPLGGRPAWSGSFGAWRQVTVDLSSLAGSNVAVRWRFATDSSVSAEGWFIDDVEFDAATYSCSAPLASPGEASEPFVPGQPFRIAKDPGGYNLTWDAPQSGGPVSEYLLYETPLGQPPLDPVCSGTLGAGTSLVLASLPDDLGFLIVARNAAGEGPYGTGTLATRPSATSGVCP